MDYLKDDQYYIDLYDLLTIKECLYWENAYQNKDLAKEKLTAKESRSAKEWMTNLTLYFVKEEEYRKKSERIKEWKEKDRVKQERFDNATEPRGIYCPNDGELMHATLKTLEDYTNQPLRVLFFFECPSCKKRKAIFEGGEEHLSKPKLCSKCSSEVKTTYKKNGQVLTTTYKCSSCGFVETEVDDYEKEHKEWEKKQAEDRKLLAKYRAKYCLSDKEGAEHVSWTSQLKYLMESVEEEKRKKADPAYQKALQLKKLTIVELEKFLSEALGKEKYIKLTLDKPEMGRQVIVPFTVQDADSARKEYDSTHKLQKLVRKALEGTNWRLMSEGTTYRLGYVYGRLKGYEKEEDLAELYGWKNKSLESKLPEVREKTAID